MLNIVIPMAGRGSRFATAGYVVPKPLIDVGGKPMIQWVIENIRPTSPHRFIFICLGEHLAKFQEVEGTLKRLCPGCEIVTVSAVTEGAACTVLLARDFIDNEDQLMIANADQIVELDINQYLYALDESEASGLIMTFWANHPKWSYCRLGSQGNVVEVVEKKVVSNEATVGIYNFRHGRDYVRAADQMIAKHLRVNNEFYVAPTYNQIIAEGAKVIVRPTGTEYMGMYGLGIPEDLDFFKTTQYFEQHQLRNSKNDYDDRATLVHSLSRSYARFFNEKNVAGLTAMLASDFELNDPNVHLKGREKVLAFIEQLFKDYPNLSFASKNIVASVGQSAIEFELRLGEKHFTGVDFIEWDHRQLKRLRAYLVATN